MFLAEDETSFVTSTNKISNRKSDSVITVCQNNKYKKIFVENINEAAEKILKIKNDSVGGMELNKIISSDAVNTINEYIEFDDLSKDLLSVMSKLRTLSLVDSNGELTEVSFKIFYSIASHKNLPKFEIILRDVSLLQNITKLREEIIKRSSDENCFLASLGIPNRSVIDSCLALIYDFDTKHDFDATYATINLDICADGNLELFQKIYFNIKANLRSEDIVAGVDNNKIGLILFDCSADDSLKVFDRIIYTLQQSKDTSKVAANIGFSKINLNVNCNEIIQRCAQISEQANKNGRLYSYAYS